MHSFHWLGPHVPYLQRLKYRLRPGQWVLGVSAEACALHTVSGPLSVGMTPLPSSLCPSAYSRSTDLQ